MGNRLLELLEDGNIIGRSNNGYWEFKVREDALTEDEKQIFYNTPTPFEYGNTSKNREKTILKSENLRNKISK